MLENTASAFDALFSPRAIAVVGASSNPLAIGGQPISYLQKKGYAGAIYPVNPRHAEIAGLKAYPDLAALPGVPDLVVVAVAAPMVTAVIRQAGEMGVAFAIVFSSGFAETGADGQALQRDLEEATKTGIRVIGPNCQGLMNIAGDVRVGFGVPYGLDYYVGGTSLTSQSGAFGNSIVMGVNAEGVGLRRYVSTGNEATTTTLDLIDAYLDDPGTSSIGAYVEGLRDGTRLRGVAEKALRLRKPIVMWKVGNTESGAKAAASHTANLAGDAALYFSAFRQFGIIEADDIADMADSLKAFSTPALPAGPRTLMITVSGGAGIVMADRASRYGLEASGLSEPLAAELRETLPAFASIANPLDVTAEAITGGEAFANALRKAGESGEFDMIAIGFAAIGGPAAGRAATAMIDLLQRTAKPIAVSWTPIDDAARAAVDLLQEEGIPVYPTPGRCMRGVGALWRFAEAAKRLDTGDMATGTAAPLAQIGEPVTMDEAASKDLLRDAGIAIPDEALVASADEAVAAAGKIGYPVVLKIVSADLPHKSDVGGVRVNLVDAAAVRAAFEDMQNIPARIGRRIKIAGALVAPMIKGGVETIIGAMRDPALGPAVMFGAGGIYAEAFGDVAFRLAPLTRADAMAMIEETKVSTLLKGARGQQRADIDALVDLLVRVGNLVANPEKGVVELDINPAFVRPEGQGVVIADALVKRMKA
ncbi:acetate--CoA ligase family protein [Mesorhizobium sp. CAU 1741]|uniref:acetate--CoA ligase family protein n=1 Tax=Mesorhizobium sp. CAU 1741 TaxID=3140366 RepID=UPI00325B9CF6